MARVFIHQELIARIDQYGFGKELKGFIEACQKGTHPPRIYKASGIRPAYKPYEMLDLYHHHLHRDGDPLLITQHIDSDIYGIALATHESYFRSDNMLWLKEHMASIDWAGCESLRDQVSRYEPES
jgi:hypothetical protein